MADDGEGSLVAAVRSGVQRTQLEAIRDRLASEMLVAEGSAVAALAKQLRETLAELRNVPVAGEVAKVDDIATRRAQRGAPNLASPTKRGLVSKRA